MSKEPRYHLSDDHMLEYLDGELTPAMVEKVQRHIGQCNDCGVKLQAWQALFSEIEEVPDLVGVVDVEPSIMAHLIASRTRPWWPSGLLIGQAMLSLGLVIYGWYQLSSYLPLPSLQGWVAAAQDTALEWVSMAGAGFDQVLDLLVGWLPSVSDILGQIPEIPLGGSLMTYASIMAVLLWIVTNRLLLDENGRREDARPRT